jgi:CRISPR system Cascade subunit CasE
MYVTKLTLNPRSAQARRDIGDAYEMHRTLVRAFAPGPQTKPPRFLWRLETIGSCLDGPILLVQSEVEADWSVLEQLPNYLHRHVESKNLQLSSLVESDRRYRFRLMANPTVSREGKRLGLLRESEQLSWVERQGERHGFLVESVIVSARDLLNTRSVAKAPICVQRVCFEGHLEVRQVESFTLALISGIGPAKAFGCGLLSIAIC